MKTVDIHSTKAEETQHLKDIAATCKPGSYLASLFTPEFIAHVEAQIKDDFTPDIMGELEAAHSQGITAATEPMMRSKHDGYTEECFTAFTGYKATIEPAPRYSAKKLETYQAEYNAKRGKAYQLTQQMIKRIIEQQQLDASDYGIEEL